MKPSILQEQQQAVPSTLSVHANDFNATKSPRRSAGFYSTTFRYLGTVTLLPVEVGDAVVQGVVLFAAPVVEAESAVVVPLVLGVLAAEVVVPTLLQSVVVGLLVVPVVPLIVDEVEGEVDVVEALLPSAGVVPIEDPEFCCVLGVVPAEVPMPEVEVLGLVCGVAVLPAGVLVVCPLTLPVAVELEVCPTPAGIEAVLPIVV